MEAKKPIDKKWKQIQEKFSITRFIGSGSCGEVARVKHRETREVYAVKLVKFDQQNTFQMKNLVRELSILRQLSQMKNNIFTVKLYDVILPKNSKQIDKIDHIFLVTDFMESDIQKLVQVTQPDNFDSNHLTAIIYNFLCAINYLHSAGVMHRDLKSENILIDDECRIKICDFGMARTVTNHSLEQDYDSKIRKYEDCKIDFNDPVKRCLTRNVCTRWYRAPELFLLENQYDSKIDMWGFGCILFEMTFLNTRKEACNTDKILFISEEEQQNILSSSSSTSADDFSVNKIDANAVKNILKITGAQTNESLSFIKNHSIVSSIQKLQMKYEQREPTIKSKLQHADPNISQLITNLLKFNPNERWSTTQALKMPIFDSVRITQLEEPAPFKIQIEMDDEEDKLTTSSDCGNDYTKSFLMELLELTKLIEK